MAAIGGPGIADLDATLTNASGAPLAHDTTTEPQAVLHPCLEAAGAYVLAVKAAAGAGSLGGGRLGGRAPERQRACGRDDRTNGTCEAPIPLETGTASGSTTRGDHETAGSCGSGDSRELVYELDVTRRQRATFEVEAHFDSVLYIRKDDCTDANAEVDCNDDGPDRTHSRIERVLEPGKYYVFVDGYGQESGAFKLTVTTSDVLALAEICQSARADRRHRAVDHHGGHGRRRAGDLRKWGGGEPTRRGTWRSQHARACASSSTPTTWRPSSTFAARAPTSKARWLAARQGAGRATRP